MQQYSVPQFIEREARIAFFISFKQFFYLILAGVICFCLYFILPFFLFLIATLLIAGVALAVGFLKIGGVPILSIIGDYLGFFGRTKNYTWKKKESPYPFRTIKKAKIQKLEEKPILKAQESRLKKIKTQVELRTK